MVMFGHSIMSSGILISADDMLATTLAASGIVMSAGASGNGGSMGSTGSGPGCSSGWVDLAGYGTGAQPTVTALDSSTEPSSASTLICTKLLLPYFALRSPTNDSWPSSVLSSSSH